MIKWIAATALDLGQGSLRPYLPSMLHVVGREVNDKSAQAGKSTGECLTKTKIDLNLDLTMAGYSCH